MCWRLSEQKPPASEADLQWDHARIVVRITHEVVVPTNRNGERRPNKVSCFVSTPRARQARTRWEEHDRQGGLDGKGKDMQTGQERLLRGRGRRYGKGDTERIEKVNRSG